MNMDCPFQVGDQVLILPEVRYWRYYVDSMSQYVNTEMTIREIELDYEGQIRLWMVEDDYNYFWSPQYCALVTTSIIVDTEELL